MFEPNTDLVRLRIGVHGGILKITDRSLKSEVYKKSTGDGFDGVDAEGHLALTDADRSAIFQALDATLSEATDTLLTAFPESAHKKEAAVLLGVIGSSSDGSLTAGKRNEILELLRSQLTGDDGGLYNYAILALSMQRDVDAATVNAVVEFTASQTNPSQKTTTPRFFESHARFIKSLPNLTEIQSKIGSSVNALYTDRITAALA